MLYVALNILPGSLPGTMTLGTSQQTAAQAGFVPTCNDDEVFLIQPVDGDIFVSFHFAYPAVATGIGCFKLVQGLYATISRGQLTRSNWIAAGTVHVTVQGCKKPPFPNAM